LDHAALLAAAERSDILTHTEQSAGVVAGPRHLAPAGGAPIVAAVPAEVGSTIVRALLLAPLALAVALPAAAQQAPSAEEVEALLARMQRQLERMTAASAERDQALKFLEQQIEAATGRLSTSGQTAESLRQSKAELESKVETLASDREQLQARLETVEDERDRRIRELASRLDQLNALLAGLERDKAGLGERLAAAETARASDRERLASLEQELVRRGERIVELEARLGQGEARLGASAGEIDRLTRLLGATTGQLQRVAGALERSQAEVEGQKLVIADLGQRLNAALLEQVEQLEQYRSEFFGRLRQVLGERQDVVIVGDRFVFPSELLFPSGSARLEPEGEAQLRRLAASLREVAATIPKDVDWVLRVDGHTDRRPVGAGSPFRSNWELSSARAISVVEFLIREGGIPPARLAAAGFGEHQPLEPGEGEAAFRRNRRIEFKLTER
jgi:chemotaxis protein MotB